MTAPDKATLPTTAATPAIQASVSKTRTIDSTRSRRARPPTAKARAPKGYGKKGLRPTLHVLQPAYLAIQLSAPLVDDNTEFVGGHTGDIARFIGVGRCRIHRSSQEKRQNEGGTRAKLVSSPPCSHGAVRRNDAMAEVTSSA